MDTQQVTAGGISRRTEMMILMMKETTRTRLLILPHMALTQIGTLTPVPPIILQDN
jgi:hypothetical protein